MLGGSRNFDNLIIKIDLCGLNGSQRVLCWFINIKQSNMGHL